MKIYTLGTGTLHPVAGQASAGLAIETEGEVLGFDFGRGVLNRYVEAGLDPRPERAQSGAKRSIRIPEPEGQEPVNVAARDRYDFTLFGHGAPQPKPSWNEHRGG